MGFSNFPVTTTLWKQSKRKIIEIDILDTHITQIHDCLLSCLGTGTSIKSGGINLVYEPKHHETLYK
jgi:hypothetical protein